MNAQDITFHIHARTLGLLLPQASLGVLYLLLTFSTLPIMILAHTTFWLLASGYWQTLPRRQAHKQALTNHRYNSIYPQREYKIGIDTLFNKSRLNTWLLSAWQLLAWLG